MTTQRLPSSLLAVLYAMTQPDPRPPLEFDSPADAVQRRLPQLVSDDMVEILHTLKALGLIAIPYVTGTTTPAATSDLRQWITHEGWEALGMETDGSDRPPS